MFSVMNFNSNLSVRALAVLYPGAAKGAAPSVAVCVAGVLLTSVSVFGGKQGKSRSWSLPGSTGLLTSLTGLD